MYKIDYSLAWKLEQEAQLKQVLWLPLSKGRWP